MLKSHRKTSKVCDTAQCSSKFSGHILGGWCEFWFQQDTNNPDFFHRMGFDCWVLKGEKAACLYPGVAAWGESGVAISRHSTCANPRVGLRSGPGL